MRYVCVFSYRNINHLLKTMIIFAWSRYLQKLVSAWAIHRFIFNFYIAKWISLVLQMKFRFMGCLVKANSLVLGNIAFSLSSQPSAEIFSKFFRQYVCELLENSSSASKCVPKSLSKFTKKHLWRSLMLVKLQAFTGATTGYVL